MIIIIKNILYLTIMSSFQSSFTFQFKYDNLITSYQTTLQQE